MSVNFWGCVPLPHSPRRFVSKDIVNNTSYNVYLECERSEHKKNKFNCFGTPFFKKVL